MDSYVPAFECPLRSGCMVSAALHVPGREQQAVDNGLQHHVQSAISPISHGMYVGWSDLLLWWREGHEQLGGLYLCSKGCLNTKQKCHVAYDDIFTYAVYNGQKLCVYMQGMCELLLGLFTHSFVQTLLEKWSIQHPKSVACTALHQKRGLVGCNTWIKHLQRNHNSLFQLLDVEPGRSLLEDFLLLGC